VEGGIWWEDNDFHQARRFYGLGLDNPGRDSLKFQSNPFFTQREHFFNTKTNNLHLQDTWKVTDALKVNYGFKTVKVENVSNRLLGTLAAGSIKVDKGFLPQIGFNYDFGDKGETFAVYNENVRAFVSAISAGPFSTTQDAFDNFKSKLRPETSKTFELGYRYRNSQFDGSVAVYNVKFKDRLLGVTTGAAIVGNPTVLINAGAVTSNGFEAVGTWRVMDNWSLFGSYSYNKSTYDDDVYDDTGKLLYKVAGKVTVDSPKNLLKSELAYDNGPWSGRLSASYTDKRSYTYTADNSVDAFTVVDLSAGYRFESQNTLLNGVEVQANITNLLDEQYFSTVGSAGFNPSDPKGTQATLMVGAPRQYYVTIRKTF
jgi:iron complex outermembrane receptor protein